MSFLPKFLGHLQYLKTTSDAKRNNIPFHQPTRFAAKTPDLLFCHPKTIAMTHMLKWHAVHRIPTITFFTHTKITILLSEVGNQPAADGSWYFYTAGVGEGPFWKGNFSLIIFVISSNIPDIGCGSLTP